MVKEIILPKLGQTMDEGTIIEWFRQEGDAVDRGEVIFALESDKAALDVESPGKGFLRRILVPAGETVPVLTVVALMTKTRDEPLPTDEAEGSTSRATEAASEPQVATEAPARSSPTSVTKQAQEAGERKRIFASPRARRKAREQDIDLEKLAGTGPNGRIVEQDVLDYVASQPDATPVAERLARHEGIDLTELEGSGPNGRITKSDVESAIRATEPVLPAAPARPAEAGVVAQVPMQGVRARIADHMLESHRATAPVTLTTEVDATHLVDTRERLKESLADQLGFNVGYNDLLIKLVARSLKENPYMNARLVTEGDQQEAVIQHLEQINVGLAVDTDRGLIVPVIENAPEKSLSAIARELRELVKRVREGQALPDELSGGTFTITNLGMHDIDAFTPIINLPEAAILGVGRIKEAPAVVNGELCVRHKMWLSLTFDHRLVDGAPAARFLQRVKSLIEEPYLLLA